MDGGGDCLFLPYHGRCARRFAIPHGIESFFLFRPVSSVRSYMPLLRGIAVAGDSGDRTAERPALWTGLFEFQFEFPPKFVERGVLAAQVGELVFRLDGADCAPVLFYFDVEYDRSVEPRDVTQQGNQLLLVLNDVVAQQIGGDGGANGVARDLHVGDSLAAGRVHDALHGGRALR